eukprot:2765824-Alexandrium_andersonii.AAC.1
MRGVLAEVAPVVKRPRKDWISTRTWALMDKLRAYKGAVRSYRRRLFRFMLWRGFIKWLTG